MHCSGYKRIFARPLKDLYLRPSFDRGPWRNFDNLSPAYLQKISSWPGCSQSFSAIRLKFGQVREVTGRLHKIRSGVTHLTASSGKAEVKHESMESTRTENLYGRNTSQASPLPDYSHRHLRERLQQDLRRWWAPSPQNDYRSIGCWFHTSANPNNSASIGRSNTVPSC